MVSIEYADWLSEMRAALAVIHPDIPPNEVDPNCAYQAWQTGVSPRQFVSGVVRLRRAGGGRKQPPSSSSRQDGIRRFDPETWWWIGMLVVLATGLLFSLLRFAPSLTQLNQMSDIDDYVRARTGQDFISRALRDPNIQLHPHTARVLADWADKGYNISPEVVKIFNTIDEEAQAADVNDLMEMRTSDEAIQRYGLPTGKETQDDWLNFVENFSG